MSPVNITEQKRWHITTFREDRLVAWQEPMADPFLTHTVTLMFGWKDRLRCLIGKPSKVTISVGADSELSSAVMRLQDDGKAISLARTESDGAMAS